MTFSLKRGKQNNQSRPGAPSPKPELRSNMTRISGSGISAPQRLLVAMAKGPTGRQLRLDAPFLDSTYGIVPKLEYKCKKAISKEMAF
jgi:hypothetical protein